MDDVIKYLEELEDLIDSGRAMPFSGKIGIDKEEAYDIITDIRNSLPNEMKQSKLIVQERNKILIGAKQEADEILKDAEEKVARLIDENEITRQAYQQSAEIIENAKRQAKEMRINAMEYADEVLAQAEEKLSAMIESFRNECVAMDEYFNHSLNTIYENRQELRGISTNNGR